MSQITSPFPEFITMADLLDHLGGIAPNRVRWQPLSGTATEDDVLAIHDRENKLFDLADGVLVEKVMGIRESVVAAALIGILEPFVNAHDLGFVTAPDGMMRLGTRLISIPDVSFVSWARLPEGKFPDKPIPELFPDLAVAVLSDSNTPAEMKQKRREYFKAGTRLAWMVDPAKRTVDVYTSLKKFTVLTEVDCLDGGDVIPGFTLPISRLFVALDRHAP
jgi:Uma2 family endonuclease